GLTSEAVTQFYADWASTQRVVTMTSQGVNQSVVGTDKVVAIINCHLATGRIGRPGMGPFSLTGQPNAMGGREVGGLANQLAAHMGFTADDVDRVRRFWHAPHMAEREGLKAVQMFEAIERGEIKGARAFALGRLATFSDEDYDALEPVQWPVRKDAADSARLFDSGNFSTPDRKARFIAPEPPALREETNSEYPLRLNTGRLRDQWHSMTRSGQSPKLGAHKPGPFLEIHPLDAKAYGLANNGFTRVRSR